MSTERIVKVVPYGDHGCTPKDHQQCPYRGEVCCVSRSGDGLCGGYEGHESETEVRCSEPRTFPVQKK